MNKIRNIRYFSRNFIRNSIGLSLIEILIPTAAVRRSASLNSPRGEFSVKLAVPKEAKPCYFALMQWGTNKLNLQQKIHQKIQLASELFEFAFELKRHQIKKKYASLSDKDLQKKIIELFHGKSDW